MTYSHKDVEIVFSEGNAQFLAEVDGTKISSGSLRECRAAIEAEQDRAAKIHASRKLALPVVYLLKRSDNPIEAGAMREGTLTGINRNTRELTIANLPRENEASYIIPATPENRVRLTDYATARAACRAFEDWYRGNSLAPRYGSRIDAKDYGTMLDALESDYAAGVQNSALAAK